MSTTPDRSPAHEPKDAGPAPMGPIQLVRKLLLMVGGSLPLLLIVLWLALDGQVTGHLDDPLPWILVGVGTLACIAGVRFARQLPLRAEDLDGFVVAHRTGVFIGLATAELPALLGFVAAFIVEAVWPMLIGLVPTALGLLSLAPTRSRLREYDRIFRSRGRDLQPSSLLDPVATTD